MANWVFTDNELGLQAIEDTSTTQQHSLGYKRKAKHATYGEGEFVYALGVASTIATDWVVLNPDDWSTTRLVANSIGPVGVAMSANVASQYGWYQVYGKAIGGSGGAIADNAQIYAHGTAGLVDDAVVDGDMVHNAKCASTISGASITGEFEIYYPYCDDIAGND